MIKKMHIVVRAVVWGSLMALSVLLTSGCTWFGLMCTEVGCNDAVDISIRGLEANQLYQIEVKAADATIKCTIDTSDATNEDMRMTCDTILFYYSQIDDAYLQVPGTPSLVSITVWQSGTMIVQDEVSPDYHELAPNGEACGPVCRTADIPIEL